ncbi:hypothetical protein SAMN05660297_01449 [Natronincola peptidivorans]|uniref:Uncharacterized protein n=1 Tax=Natronincola peptidivorans TaxID=426128 RepID=A0A1I0BWU7_9FIRM|nr:hypothetical protein [Natronincola peptidivorans]SET11318.1 hypothetical protein SAMN05660297_01449 [Natronincola peptidivorans]
MKDAEINNKGEENHKLTFEEVITGITWLMGTLAFITFLTESYGWFFYTFFSITFISGFLVKPCIILIRESKTRLISFREMTFLSFKIFALCLGLASGYIVFVSPLYDLFWSYWGLLTFFVLLFIISIIERIGKEEEGEEKEEQGRKTTLAKLKKVAYFVFSVVIALPNIHQMYTPSQVVALQEVAAPKTINVYEMDQIQESNRRGMLGYRQEVDYSIEEEAIIYSLIEEMEGSVLENLRYIRELNYSKMKQMETPYFYLDFYYEESSQYPQIRKGEKDVDKARYITRVIIYPNKRAYIQLSSRERRIFEIFPIDLSDDIIEALVSFDL